MFNTFFGRKLPEMSPALKKLLEWAKSRPPMTAEQIEAQRKSWVIGEMMLEHPEMSRAQAEDIYNDVRKRGH